MTTASAKEILCVVELYLDGLYEGDTAKLRQTFNENACLLSLTNGKVSNLPLEDWCKMVEGRASAKSQKFDRWRDRILEIQETAPNCAFVRLQCAAPGRLFTDQLGLLKVDGGWQIVNKIFHADIV
jgi:hypothetical protein